MTALPLVLQWTAGGFELATPIAEAQVLVADSWRVRAGRTWGLTDHLDRFRRGIAAQGVRLESIGSLDMCRLTNGVEQNLADIAEQHPETDLFPRLSLESHEGSHRLVLLDMVVSCSKGLFGQSVRSRVVQNR